MSTDLAPVGRAAVAPRSHYPTVAAFGSDAAVGLLSEPPRPARRCRQSRRPVTPVGCGSSVTAVTMRGCHAAPPMCHPAPLLCFNPRNGYSPCRLVWRGSDRRSASALVIDYCVG
ncbi:hypothetical protein GCM10029963_58160 [Micromonospora andamanensis]|nr:hypothetical protein Vwe01_12420 [Micromonospora andamanensis]